MTSLTPKRELNLFDSVAIIVGIIIGSGIYETAPTVASVVPDFSGLMLVWFAGGILSLCGALCYAELATTYPEEGGEYVFFRRAYGSKVAFLFAWAQLIIIRPGSIAAILFPFAHYAKELVNPFYGTNLVDYSEIIISLLAILALTMLNFLGIKSGKWTQNVLSVLKVAGLVIIVGTALIHMARAEVVVAPLPEPTLDLSLAMILVLFTYGGWNEIATVAAEVKNPSRNLLLSLVLGVVGVTLIYLAVNAAYFFLLGHSAMSSSGAVAAQSMAVVWPSGASNLVALIICASTLGSANGMILTGARISYAFGLEHRNFAWLARWDEARSAPTTALLLQALLSAMIVVLAGSFSQSVVYTTSVAWTFFFLAGISLFVLRARDPDTHRPYRVSFYPLTPAIFSASAIYLVYSALIYDLKGSLTAFALLFAGLLLWRRPHIQSNQ